MSKSSLFEQMGGTYTKVGDYYFPDLTLPDDGLGEDVHIGIWGMRRLDYLKKYKRVPIQSTTNIRQAACAFVRD